MINAVFFDVDGVLLDSFEANLKFFQTLMATAGYRQPTRQEFPSIFHLSLHDAVKALTQSTSQSEIERVYEMGRNRIGYPVELLSLPEGAEEVITSLAGRYPLGIVTSRVRESVYEAPQLAALQKYFKVVISYDDTVNHKPHPEPLQRAAEKIGVRPQECVYIGDVENDIQAARAAGMKIIIYSQRHFDTADVCTPSFRHLPELITALQANVLDYHHYDV